MHPIEEHGTNVPAFLLKLWKIVEDPDTNDLISWSSGGISFFIRNQNQFAHELLPLHYKHNNLASFVRQLNMYGFHKVVSSDGGGLKPDKDEMEFAHQCFLQGHPYLLQHIKRKVPVKQDENVATVSGNPEIIKKVLSDVKGLKGRQESVSTQLSDMKRENEVLWREVAVLRQKHLKQQQIVNKLIQFLVSMVHTSRSGGIGIKRHYPFMLSNTPHGSSKTSKLNADEISSNPSPGGPVIHELDATDIHDSEPEQESMAKEYLSGDFGEEPVMTEVSSPTSTIESIHDFATAVNTSSPDVLLELAEECSLSPDIFSPDIPDIEPAKVKNGKKSNKRKRGKKTNENEAILDSLSDNLIDVVLPSVMNENAQDGSVLRGLSREELDGKTKALVELTEAAMSRTDEESENKTFTEPSTSNTDRSKSPNMTLACTDSSDLSRCGLSEDLDLHLDSMDSELDSLKELLQGEGYSFDANTLFGLFSEDPYAYELPFPMETEIDSTTPGSELMAYNTPTLDLTDMLGLSADEWKQTSSPPPTNNVEKETDLLVTPDVKQRNITELFGGSSKK